MKTVISLCDKTGIMLEPWKAARYNTIQIDIQHGDDVRLLEIDQQLKLTGSEVIGIIAQPPCTHFAGSGARWWKEKGEEKLLEGLELISACTRIILAYNPKWWILENPVGRLPRWLGPWTMTFHPHEYAGWLTGNSAQQERYKKKTCLWGNFKIPEKKDLGPHENKKIANKIHLASPSEDRADKRSVAPRGFAKAFYESNR